MTYPIEVPVMTLPQAVLFPQAMLPLHIFEPRYRRMLSDVLHSHRMFAVALRRPGSARETPCAVAGLGLVRASVSREDGTSNLILQGLARVHLSKAVRYRPYRVHRVRAIEALVTDVVVVDALMSKVLQLVGERLRQGSGLPQHLLKKLSQLEDTETPLPKEDAVRRAVELLAGLEDAGQVADLVACSFLTSPLERQILLETMDTEERLKHLIHFLLAEVRRLRKTQGT